MTERAMSAKGFLHKAKSKAANSPTAFLAAHREWLLSGELAETVNPILIKLDAKEILPTPALTEVRQAVLNHLLNQETKKADHINREKVVKNHEATIYDPEGNILTRTKEDGSEEILVKGFEMPQDAMRWVDNRLFQAYAGCAAILVHNHTNSEEVIERDDSIARILKTGKGAVCKQTSKTTSRLSFGVKAKQSHASFSRG